MSSSPATAATLTHSPGGGSTGRGRRSSRAGANGSGTKRKGVANSSTNSNGPSPDNSGSDEEIESLIPVGVDVGGNNSDSGRKTRSSSNTPTNGPNPVTNAGFGKRTSRRENSTHSNHSGSRESSSVQGGNGCLPQRGRSRERSRSDSKSSIGAIDTSIGESLQEEVIKTVKTNGEESEVVKSPLQTTTCSTPIRSSRSTRMSSLEENGSRSSRDEDNLDGPTLSNCTNVIKSNVLNTRKTNNLNKMRGKRKSSAANNSENSDSGHDEECSNEENETQSSNAIDTKEGEGSSIEATTSVQSESNTTKNEPSGNKLNGPIETENKSIGKPTQDVVNTDENDTAGDKPRNFDEFKKQVEANLRVEDGRHAEAIDERSIRCICKKVIRTCSRFNWSYLIQKPKIRNGVVYQRGHWFACPDVAKGVSCIKPSDKICDDTDDSNEIDSRENSTSDLPTDLIGTLATRRVSKRVTGEKDEPSSKRARNANYSEIDDDDFDDDEADSDDSDEEEESEEESSQEEDEEEHFSLYKNISTLLQSRVPGEIFIQDGPCFQMARDGLVMCHVCKYMPKAERRDMLRRGNFDDPECEISCCFYSFRKLKYMKSGNMVVSGYLDPQKDVKDPCNATPLSSNVSTPKGTPKSTSLVTSATKITSILASSNSSSISVVDESKNALEQRASTPVPPDDMSMWRPISSSSVHATKDVEKTKLILGLIGDQFCDMVLQEQKCLILNKEQAENKQVVWKKAVKGVREMCDVCKTTLFNHHWTCGRCGIYVCLDCYKFRTSGLVKDQTKLDASFTDEYDWPRCTNGEDHKIEKLLLAQIIPKTALVDLASKMHEVRDNWDISQFCHRPKEFKEILTGDGLQQSRVSLSFR